MPNRTSHPNRAAIGFAATALVALMSTSALAQNPGADANAHFQAAEWPEAVAAYRAIVDGNPDNGPAWLRLATSLQNTGDHPGAIAAAERALTLKAFPPIASFRIAVSHAAQGDADEAFEWLDKALTLGFNNEQLFNGAAPLQKLQDDKRFGAAKTRLAVLAHPCRHDPKRREFDFWVGDWTVHTANGAIAGNNSIQDDLDGCMLFENWASARGAYQGKSMNFYDPTAGQWVQRWIDTSGTTIHIAGGLEAGAMKLVGSLIDLKGSKTPFRGTWTPLDDGRVRQLFEQSTDGGKTWATWFDGFYSRTVPTTAPTR